MDIVYLMVLVLYHKTSHLLFHQQATQFQTVFKWLQMDSTVQNVLTDSLYGMEHVKKLVTNVEIGITQTEDALSVIMASGSMEINVSMEHGD